MDDKELRTLLKQLHQEIEQVDSIDEKGKELLQDLNTDIRELLERSGNLQAEKHPLTILHLGDTIRYLEVTHPTLTATLDKLMTILSNAGI